MRARWRRDLEQADGQPLPREDEQNAVDAVQFNCACQVEEDKILETEGAYHAGGLYFAKQSDATFWRICLAQQRVRERARQRDIATRKAS